MAEETGRYPDRPKHPTIANRNGMHGGANGKYGGGQRPPGNTNSDLKKAQSEVKD